MSTSPTCDTAININAQATVGRCWGYAVKHQEFGLVISGQAPDFMLIIATGRAI